MQHLNIAKILNVFPLHAPGEWLMYYRYYWTH